jgi:hypothetical protein
VNNGADKTTLFMRVHKIEIKELWRSTQVFIYWRLTSKQFAKNYYHINCIDLHDAGNDVIANVMSGYGE